MTAAWGRGQGWGVVDRPGDGEHGGTLYAAALDTGVIHVLEGPAAVVCRAALGGVDAEGVRHVLADQLDVEATDVDDLAVEALLDDLVSLGVLRREAAGAGQSPAGRPLA